MITHGSRARVVSHASHALHAICLWLLTLLFSAAICDSLRCHLQFNLSTQLSEIQTITFLTFICSSILSVRQPSKPLDRFWRIIMTISQSGTWNMAAWNLSCTSRRRPVRVGWHLGFSSSIWTLLVFWQAARRPRVVPLCVRWSDPRPDQHTVTTSF